MTKQELAVSAHNNKEAIIETKNHIGKGFLRLALLLKTNRDMLLWKALGYDTFEEFIADPDISFSRSKVYGLIQTYELYVEKLKITEDKLSFIGSRRLQLIAPVVEGDPDKWLDNAQNMSRSDLIEEVRAAQGKQNKIKGPPTQAHPSSPVPSPYPEYVKASPCCVCGKKPIDLAHYPETRVRGAEWKVIPLCRECHRAQHDGGMKWQWDNRVQLFNFFYEIIKAHFIGE